MNKLKIIEERWAMMNVLGPLERAKHYIDHQSKLTETADKSKLPQGPCVTISRETGAGADKVSEKLVEFFDKFYTNTHAHWTVFDKNLIEKVLQDHHLPQRLSELMGEQKYSGIKSMMGELLVGQPGIWTLVHKTTETILQLAQMGNVIVVDRGANVITGALKTAFHVRLVAPMEDRISHIMALFNYDKKEAIDYIKKEDEDRKEYLSTYFHRDINDPLLYHMVINTKMINDEEAAKIIGNAVLSKFPKLFAIGD